jgi:hypothetical protein
MTTATTALPRVSMPGPKLRVGSLLMAVGGAGFIGYAIIFFIRNFTGTFLELGIGSGEVNVNKSQIQEFSPSLYHYISHLHIGVSGFIAASGLAVIAFGVVRRPARPVLGVGDSGCGSGVGAGGRAASALPQPLRHARPSRPDLRRHRAVRGGRRRGARRAARTVCLIRQSISRPRRPAAAPYRRRSTASSPEAATNVI